MILTLPPVGDWVPGVRHEGCRRVGGGGHGESVFGPDGESTPLSENVFLEKEEHQGSDTMTVEGAGSRINPWSRN